MTSNHSLIAKRLKEIRTLMEKENIEAYVLFHDDEFNNEYLPPRHERLAFLTGFTGSAGFTVITRNLAALIVPGLYTLQVRLQTDQELFTYLDLQKDSLKNWLVETLQSGQSVGLDASIVNTLTVKNLEKDLATHDLSLTLLTGTPLVDRIWSDDERPKTNVGSIRLYDENMAGFTVFDKKQIIIQSLKEEQAQAVVLNELDSIAWFLNIRGGDVPFNPLVLSYLIVDIEGEITFFVDTKKITALVQKHLDRYEIQIKEIDLFYQNLSLLKDKTVLINTASMPIAVTSFLEQNKALVLHGKNPCTLPKAIKTKAEQNSMRQAHIIDGIALVKFLYWLDHEGEKSTIDELSAIEKLQALREESDLYQGPSFDTIAAAGPNGAIIHYRANTDTNARLEKNSLFLCDSGGQYKGGTTDVTRTVAIGQPSKDMIKNFTLVLKGHIKIAALIMKPGTTGADIDPIARAALQENGLDYNHGTGHGVGVELCVHEGPAGISPRNTVPLEKGMILSNEPGYYKEGAYGIRIESLVLIHEDNKNNLYFETLTLAPIDKNLITLNLLTKDEINWLNGYHAQVFDILSPYLNEQENDWLESVTAPL